MTRRDAPLCLGLPRLSAALLAGLAATVSAALLRADPVPGADTPGASAAPGQGVSGPSTPGVFSVRAHGAVGDGLTSDTAAINAAVEACAARGGGQIVFSPGKYLSGTVRLRSNVTLLLEDGATLLGTTSLDDYRSFSPPAGVPEAGWGRWHRALILGDGVEKVSIAGRGTIDGNKVFDPKGEEKMRGPHTIILGNSSDITIRDVSIRDSANYAIFLQHCQKVDIRGVKITGGWDAVHFRGWPGRPCRDITIAGCEMYTGDDCIAGRYWENVLIANCVLNSSCNCVRLIGPATDLIIHDCLFYGPGVHPHRTSSRRNTLAGLNLQPGAWDATEGALDRGLVSDIVMQNVSTPFHFSLKPGNTAGRMVVSRVTATGVYRTAASVESWAESPFEDVVFRDVSIEFAGGGTAEQARVPVKAPGVDARPLPAWGFYGRNVKSLRLQGVRLGFEKDDFRPAVILDGVKRLTLDGLRYDSPEATGTGGEAASAAEPLILGDVERLRLSDVDFAAFEASCVELRAVAVESSGEQGSSGEAGLPKEPDSAGRPASSGRLVEGRPYCVVATAQGGDREGLGEVTLSVKGQTAKRWVWLKPHEKKDVAFRGLVAPAAGTHEARAGGVTRSFTVEPRPPDPKPDEKRAGERPTDQEPGEEKSTGEKTAPERPAAEQPEGR